MALIFQILLLVIPYSQAGITVTEEIDSVETLIRDSEFSKAALVLKGVDSAKLVPADKIRYYFLKGMLEFESKEYVRALENYRRSKKMINYAKSQNFEIMNNSIDAFIAQSNFALGNYEEAINSLIKQKDRTEKSYLILSSSYWKLSKHKKAFKVLNDGITKYPNHSGLGKQRAIYFSELGLVHELYLNAKKLLSTVKENNGGFDKLYFLFLVQLVRQKGEAELSLKLLESLHLRSPDDPDVLAELAHIYFTRGKLQAAKDLYIKAAQINPKYAYQATELLIQTNDLILAKLYNSLIKDQKKRTKQKFAIELKMNNYNEAYFLKDELNQLGLLKEDSILYALAYSAIKSGHIENSLKMLDRIKSPEMFKKALKLKDWTNECLQEGAWKCTI